jgi:glycosyltransferase involved in cell wall biosynthesis
MTSIDIILPVHNEEARLQDNIFILYHYLEQKIDSQWKIVIADNGSCDNTPQVAKELALKYERIQYFPVSQKGRGAALREAFLMSHADVVCYMDIDLSTNLKSLPLCLEGITQGYDIAVGSRLMSGSRIKRRMNREIISRIYNGLIKCLFFNSFSDAQCGFKAMKSDVARALVPLVKNNNWFFDTELMLLAECHKCRIIEIPVEWIEDIKTKVHIPLTIFEDLHGLLRMRITLHQKSVAAHFPSEGKKTC